MPKKNQELEETVETVETQENETENVDLTAEVETIKAELEAYKALVKELNEELERVSAESAKKDKYPTFKVGNVVYEQRIKKFIITRNGKNLTVTTELLQQDPELVRELVAKGSGALVKKGG